MRLAFDNSSGSVFSVGHEIVKKGFSESRTSPRRRILLPIHRNQDARVQRMLNFMQPGSYVRPHKHPLPHATESIVLLMGSIHFFIFDEDGKIVDDYLLMAGTVANLIDIEPGTWHSFIVLEEDTLVFEAKQGPYDAETDKVFAEWSPAEFSSESETYLNKLFEDWK